MAPFKAAQGIARSVVRNPHTESMASPEETVVPRAAHVGTNDRFVTGIMVAEIMWTTNWNEARRAYPALWLLPLIGLYVLAQYDYLLFHMSVELFSIIVAVAMFMIAWNTRNYLENGYLSLLGIAYLFIAGIDLVHAFAYKGMTLIPGDESNHATQLWIAARYLEALTLVAAPFFLHRKLRHATAVGAYAAIFAAVLLSIFVWRIFPTCYVEGSGLTLFKKASEYAISGVLVGAMGLLIRNRREFDRRVLRWLIASVLLTIGSELLFTFYVGVYDISNLFGHIFKLASFYLLYRAIIETGLRQPFALVFRKLKSSQEALQEANETLEQRVVKRTEELREANTRLRHEVKERLEAEKQLRRLNFLLKAIRNVNQLIVKEHDRERLLDEACTALVEGSGYSTAWITLNDETQRLLAASYRSMGGTFPAVSTLFSDGTLPPCAQRAWQQRGVAVVDPSESLCRDCPSRDKGCDQARMAACLEHEGVRYGLLGVTSPGELVTSEEEIGLVREVAGDIAFALRNMDLEDEKESAVQALRKALEGTIQAIAATAESRDPYTAGHQRRVTELAVRIGEELGLGRDRVDSLQVTSLLHDIGKISVPAEILSKPTKLTEVERELVRNHPRMAYDILKRIEFPWPVAEFVLQHHERIDGSGYPNGLHGDQIRLEARIIAVADVVEAISSHRPYRPALGLDAALEEIEQNADRLYDPEVVEACVRLFREKGFRFGSNGSRAAP